MLACVPWACVRFPVRACGHVCRWHVLAARPGRGTNTGPGDICCQQDRSTLGAILFRRAQRMISPNVPCDADCGPIRWPVPGRVFFPAHPPRQGNRWGGWAFCVKHRRHRSWLSKRSPGVVSAHDAPWANEVKVIDGKIFPRRSQYGRSPIRAWGPRSWCSALLRLEVSTH